MFVVDAGLHAWEALGRWVRTTPMGKENNNNKSEQTYLEI